VHIGVCLKQVPESDKTPKVADDGSGVTFPDDTKWIPNPYDEFALEAALQLKDAKIATKVTVFTVGGADAEARMKDALARGATGAVRLDDAAFAGSDALGTARILAAALEAEGVSLAFCGKQAIDSDQSQVPAMIAEVLGWPQIYVVDSVAVEGETVTATRSMGGGTSHVVQAPLPAIVTCDKGLNDPRFASLKGIMMAKRKKIAVMDAGALGLDGGVGAAEAAVTVTSWSAPPARPAGRIIDGDSPAAKVQELVRLLREEAKVI